MQKTHETEQLPKAAATRSSRLLTRQVDDMGFGMRTPGKRRRASGGSSSDCRQSAAIGLLFKIIFLILYGKFKIVF